MKILITVEGGVVQAVYLDDEAMDAKLQVVVADFDVEGTQIPDSIVDDPDGDPVLIHYETPINNSGYAEKMFALADADKAGWVKPGHEMI